MRFAKSDITVNQTSEQSRDRKVILSYTFTSFGEQCWKKYIEGKDKKKREEGLVLECWPYARRDWTK